MNDIELCKIKQLANDFRTKYPARILACAHMLHAIVSSTGTPEGDPLYDSYARLAGRIETEMTVIDEPRFTMYDYADAIANATKAVDPEKLISLGQEDFARAMIWLAADKRETYEGKDHAQPAMPYDIYAGGRP